MYTPIHYHNVICVFMYNVCISSLGELIEFLYIEKSRDGRPMEMVESFHFSRRCKTKYLV